MLLNDSDHPIDLRRGESTGEEEGGHGLVIARAPEGPNRHVPARNRHAGPDLTQGRVRRSEICEARADDVHAPRLAPMGGSLAYAFASEGFGSVTAA